MQHKAVSKRSFDVLSKNQMSRRNLLSVPFHRRKAGVCHFLELPLTSNYIPSQPVRGCFPRSCTFKGLSGDVLIDWTVRSRYLSSIPKWISLPGITKAKAANESSVYLSQQI